MEHLDRAAGVHIDQGRSVVVPATQGEIVDTQHPRDRMLRIGQRPDLAQQRRGGQLPGQTRASAPAQRAQRTLQDQRTTGVPGRELRHPLDESRFAAVRAATEQHANSRPHHDFAAGDRGVRQPPLITAVDPAGQRPAAGTPNRILTGSGIDPHR
ncbi:hypothetical protein ABZ894_26245 [Nocardia beijingensis]